MGSYIGKKKWGTLVIKKPSQMRKDEHKARRIKPQPPSTESESDSNPCPSNNTPCQVPHEEEEGYKYNSFGTYT